MNINIKQAAHVQFIYLLTTNNINKFWQEIQILHIFIYSDPIM